LTAVGREQASSSKLQQEQQFQHTPAKAAATPASDRKEKQNTSLPLLPLVGLLILMR